MEDNIIYKFMEEISKMELDTRIDCTIKKWDKIICDDCPLEYCEQCDKITYEIKEIAKEYIAENEPAFTWEQFKEGKIAVHCDTEEKARDFINKSHLYGLNWNTTKKGETNYSDFKCNTCYIYNYNECGNLGYIHKFEANKEIYKIVKWNIKEEENMDNFKFKVGDIVTGADEDQWIYGEECKITKSYLNKNGRNAYILEKSSAEWYEDELKLVENKEEIKLEKTFREVIADIKEGEVWENEFCTIEATEYDTKIRMGNASNIAIGTNVKFKLQRKQYTFTEAFKAYEEGKEIESCNQSRKYKKGTEQFENMLISDIQGKWYINN